MLNPYVCPIEGDLSRADVVQLVQLCRGKRVVEFGLGGSTLLLAKVAARLVSYETKAVWVERFKHKLAPGSDVRLIPETAEAVRGLAESCDVVWIDGHSIQRAPALLEFWPHCKAAVLHDTRLPYAGNCVRVFLDQWTETLPNGMKQNPYLATLERIDWNPGESNLCVLYRRPFPLWHEDWKVTESHNHRSGFGTASPWKEGPA